MKKRVNPIFAWFILGLLTTALMVIIMWMVTIFSVIPFSNVVIIMFAIFGFLPGLLAMFGFRIIGLAGLAGIIIGIIWGLIHALFASSWEQIIFIFDFLRVYSVAMIIGCIGQLVMTYAFPKSKRKNRKKYGEELLKGTTELKYYEV